MGILYVIATPIGNLEDITLRALSTLRKVSLIAAEDTRTTRKLLNAYDIKARLVSYNEHNHRERAPLLLKRLEQEDVALVSEAGTPGISDPGIQLVCAAVHKGIRVVPVPGSSAVTAALAAAGVPADRFMFLGFLPRRTRDRRQLLSSVAGLDYTLVLFETPHRLQESLKDIMETLGDRELVVCRELTKMHEEVFRGTVKAALERFTTPRGEFTLVVAEGGQPKAGPSDEVLRQAVARLRAQGLSARDGAAQLAKAFGVPKRRAYKMWVEG